MGQSIFMANIFRGGSLSSLTHINVTKWTQVFFKAYFSLHFLFCPPRVCIDKKSGIILEKVSRQCAHVFVLRRIASLADQF